MNEEPVNHETRHPPPQAASHVFLLRLWLAPVDSQASEWRGRLQHVNSGEARHFRAWPALLVHLQTLLGDVPSASETGTPDGDPG